MEGVSRRDNPGEGGAFVRSDDGVNAEIVPGIEVDSPLMGVCEGRTANADAAFS
ncbi:hypothetical protein M408DRAFT_332860 [Serendipita vermifera MAFF 305830]|uniref:Uncharacterized protein n=1 Tax=Serendipita vermifera MAFF 305830 TaxID=933852 RepID=A0A0C3AR75_SERVB|nr:hypothetical protein M408DRAFT_332860 [Serendipita vermifera MAFF 305830]